MIALAAVLTAYLLGSLTWSLWVGKARGVDIRRHGSGNLGATNVYRVLGWKLGILVLLLDIGKGTAAVAVARALHPGGVLPVVAALAAVVGHMLTPFSRFRGGKGVATGLGVFLGLAPVPAFLAFLVWGATLALCGWVSVASCVAASLLPVFLILFRDALGARYPGTLALGILVALLVLVRHRANWGRLARGAEQAIWEKRPESPEHGALSPPGGAP
jgi:glycerol-3-phosphate acyltransferase PlsY